MTKKIAEFAFNGKGTVTLQVTTIVLMLTMSWKISAWKTGFESKLDAAARDRFTSYDAAEWSNRLAMSNDDIIVPDVWEVLSRNHRDK